VAKKNASAARAGMAAHLAEMARLFVEAQRLRANGAGKTADQTMKSLG